MNITLAGTKVSMDGHTLAFQKNNLVDSMVITVDTDETWQYKLDVKYPCKDSDGKELYNVIDLTRVGNTCTAILQASMLPFNGKYTMQLRGISDDKVYHTDTFDVWVKYSIDPGNVYDPVPSEFYQIEQAVTEQAANAKQSEIESAESARQSAESATNAAESAAKAEDAVGHSPIVGENGNWFIWDFTKSEYVDTGKPASTPPITPDTAGKYLTNNGRKAEWGARVVENIQSFDTDKLLHVASSYVTAIIKEEGNANSGGMVFPVIAQLDGIIEHGNGFMSYLDAHGDHYVGGFSLAGGAVGVPKLTFSNTILYVTITQDGQNSYGNPIYKSDKTYAEIKAAHEAGREVKIARAGMFEDEILLTLGINDFSLDFIDAYKADFAAVGVPASPIVPSAVVGGQILSSMSIFIYKNGRVNVHFPFDIFDGEITWNENLCYKLPQQYIVTVTAGTDGTLSANNTLAQLNSVAQAYGFVTDVIGSASINVDYNGKLYYMSGATGTSLTFTATTENGLETLTVSNDGKEGSADVWTHEVVPLGGGTDISLGITGATVGQIAKITAVDTDGKPTKWEPVSEQYELLKTINIAEEINALTVTQDDNGNLFSLDSVFVCCDSGIGVGHDYKTITYQDNNNLNLTVDSALNSYRVTQFTAKNNGGFYWDEGFWANGEGHRYSQFYRNATSKAFEPINTIKLTFGEAVSQGRIRVWGIKT